MRKALILAHELEKRNGRMVLSEITRRRTDLGIELLRKGEVDRLIMSGDYGEMYGISLAEAMKNYAIEQGIEENQVIKEDLSLETVGELIFTKLGILNPRGWKDLVIITGETHYPRVKEESQYLLRDFNIVYRIVENEGFSNEHAQKESLEAFKRTFAGVDFQDDGQVLEVLLTKHPYYKHNPDGFRNRLALLSQGNKIGGS